jgi:Bacteriophage head to tail connecting protein
MALDTDGNTVPPGVQSQEDDALFTEIMRYFSQMQLWRNNFAQQWEEVAELILPTSRNTFYYQTFNWPGLKKTDRQVDASGMLALSRFAAICDSLLTPRNMIWHGLGPDVEDLKKDRATRIWFHDVTKLLFKHRYAPIGNFAANNANQYTSLGAFGTANMFVDQAEDAAGNKVLGLRYKHVPLGEMFLVENHQGLIIGFIRWFRLTAAQAKQKFPDSFPMTLQSALDTNSQYPYNFLHFVMPNENRDPKALDHTRHAFRSVYASIEGKAILEKGGYRKLPIASSRYEQTPGELYGRSPAMMVLPALKTLNAQKAVFLKVGHRQGDPVLLTADDGLVDGVSLRPGALVKGGVSSEGKPLVHVLPSGEIQTTKEMMDEEKGLVNDAFLVSLFQILEETPQMTATEVIERINEKGILIAPTLGRQQSEYLGPLIDRELDLLTQMRLLPPMPPALREAMGGYDVVYTSPLSRQARAQEAAGFIRTLESVKELVNITQDPSLLDPFDFDTAIPEIADIQAVPVTWMADDRQIAQKRQNRAKQQAAQQQIQAMPAQAAMMKAQAVAAKTQAETGGGQPQQGQAPPDQGQGPPQAGGPLGP